MSHMFSDKMFATSVALACQSLAISSPLAYKVIPSLWLANQGTITSVMLRYQDLKEVPLQ